MAESSPTNPQENDPRLGQLESLANVIIKQMGARGVIMLVRFADNDVHQISTFDNSVTHAEAFATGLDAAEAAHDLLRKIISVLMQNKEIEKDGVKPEESAG